MVKACMVRGSPASVSKKKVHTHRSGARMSSTLSLALWLGYLCGHSEFLLLQVNPRGAPRQGPA